MTSAAARALYSDAGYAGKVDNPYQANDAIELRQRAGDPKSAPISFTFKGKSPYDPTLEPFALRCVAAGQAGDIPAIKQIQSELRDLGQAELRAGNPSGWSHYHEFNEDCVGWGYQMATSTSQTDKDALGQLIMKSADTRIMANESFLSALFGGIGGGSYFARPASYGSIGPVALGADNIGVQVDPGHVAEMSANGVKFSPDNLVATGRMNDGRVVFLETGNSSAGLQHIVEGHAGDFSNIGVPQENIPEVVMGAVTQGDLVGYQGRGTGRPIFQVRVNGQTQQIAVTIGSNGFIVGANPKGSSGP
jgi:filamentous hemagglutinin